jgi:Na+/melibiose symporter-like transporter
MNLFPALFSLLVAAAGWFYMFHSLGARNLAGLEERRLNALRSLLRRAGGFLMMLLAVAFYAGFNTVDADQTPTAFVAVWIGVMALLAAVVALAMVDLWLTARLRREKTRK